MEKFVAGGFIGFFSGIILMSISFNYLLNDINDNWRKKAIQHNAAYYNLTTGAFTWNTPKVNKESLTMEK